MQIEEIVDNLQATLGPFLLGGERWENISNMKIPFGMRW